MVTGSGITEDRASSFGGLASLLLTLPVLAALLAALYCVATAPLSLGWQFASGALALGVAIFLKRRGGRRVSLMMMALSMAFSTRYLYWRLTTTLPVGLGYNSLDMILALGLVAAEIYAFLILVLGYFQVLWPLGRVPVPLPADSSLWPTVDIYIPSYNEPLSVVRPTVLAAMDIDWPADRVRVYVLDDGRRAEFKAFCEEVGVTHLIRPDNKHAKAGNINHALTKTRGEHIAIFDCDHIPTRSFLQMTVGTLVADPKVALVQTPHHFFSPDPFERNLRVFRRVPNEGELFYGLLQDGNDFWNASFFCGSCAVIRRTAIEEIGGIAVETVTEDAHTALRLHSRGWDSAYINIPQAAGLATESLSAHVGQRIRWARGMAQILRVDNPFLIPGLKLGQRLCYLNAMFHFLYGFPRLVFLSAPLAYLLFNIQIIHAQGLMILAYAAPHVLLAITTNSRLQGNWRHSFWPEVYETVLAIFIIGPTTLALVNPKLGKFNVTAKGGVVDRDYFDGNIAKPYYLLYLVNVVGVLAAFSRFVFGNPQWTDTVALNLVWSVYNLLILGAALCVAAETKQTRLAVRVRTKVPALLRQRGSAEAYEVLTEDLSNSGVLLPMPQGASFELGESVEVALIPSSGEVWTAATVRRSGSQVLALQFGKLGLAEERQVVYALYGRADAWLGWRRGAYQNDRPLRALGQVARFSLLGSGRFFRWLAGQAVAALRRGLRGAATASALLCALLVYAPDSRADAVVAMPIPASAPAAPKPSDQAFADGGHGIALSDLGQRYPLRLQTVFGQASVPLSIRRDEVVTHARLHLYYAHSPSLIPNLSHLNVLINDELQVTLPLDAASANGAERVIELNPALFGEFNQLRFEAVQHYTTDCEDPAYTSLWSVVSDRSYLELSLAPLNAAPSLSVLPRPFFDAADQRALRLPVAFASTGAGKQAYTAAAIAASWFGAQADYRGAVFPVRIGSLPDGHGVVLRVGDAMADRLGPAPQGPRLRVIANPAQPQARLLLIEAPDEAGLVTAAQALALGTYAISGDSAEIRSVELPKPADLDAAPHWADPSLPLPLKVLNPGALTVEGLTPAPMDVDFRLPPDIYFYRENGATLDLRYRYSPATAPGSSLNVFLNDGLVGASMLTKAGQVAGVDSTQVSDTTKLYLPASRLGVQNHLSVQYLFRRNVSKACEDFNVHALTGGVDPDSTLRFQHFAHYALWPDLTRLRDGGLPFSTYADLSHSVFLVPDAADEDALSGLLTVAGHLGHVTGMAALRLKVDTAGNASSYGDKDLLLIGRAGQLPDLKDWEDRMPLQFGAEGAQLRGYGAVSKWQAMVEGRDLPGALKFAGRVLSGAGHNAGALIGTSSPYGHGHGAVVITAGDQGRVADVAEALVVPALSQFIDGDLSLLVGGKVSGYQFETQYGIGSLPLFFVVQHWLYLHPYLVTPLAFAFAGVAALLLYSLLRRRARRRLQKAGGKAR